MAVKTRARTLPDGIDVIPSGRLRARYWCRGCNRHPVRGQHSKSFAPNQLRDAGKWLRKQRAEVDAETHTAPDTRTTVAEWAAKWVKLRSVRKRGSTKSKYRVVLHHIEASPLGSKAIGKVKPSDIQEWANGLDVGPGTLRGYFRVLASMFDAAVEEDGLVTRSPCNGKIDLGKNGHRATHVPLTATEIQKLRRAIASRYRALVDLQGAHGPRIGEVLGVKAEDIDRQAGTLAIERQLLPNGDLGPVKNDTTYGVRTFELAPYVLQALADHIETYPPCTKSGKKGCCAGAKPCDKHDYRGLLFTTMHGNRIRYSVFLVNVFKPAVRRAGLPEEVGTHDLRHYAGSEMLDQGVPVTTVAFVLGHSVQECTRTYLHKMHGGDAKAAAVMERVRRGLDKSNVVPIRPRRGRALPARRGP